MVHLDIDQSQEHSPRRPAPLVVAHKPKINCDHVRTKHEPEPWELGGSGVTSEPRVNKSREMHFDNIWKARTVNLSPDHSSASCRRSKYGGFLLSKQVLRKKPHGRWFEVLIEDTNTSQWTDGLGVGVAVHPSTSGKAKAEPGGFFDCLIFECCPSHWMLGYDGRAKVCGQSRYLDDPHSMPNGMFRMTDLKAGDRLGMLASYDGHLMLLVNDELRYFVPHCKIPWHEDLYAALDLDGCTKAVHLLDNNGNPNTAAMAAISSALRSQDFRQERETHLDISTHTIKEVLNRSVKLGNDLGKLETGH